MLARRHPIAHLVAILALLAGQAAMASTPCARQMPDGMAAADHSTHAPSDHSSSRMPGHPCCACTCPCRADFVRMPDLVAIVRALEAPAQRVPNLRVARRAPTLLVPTTLPPVRAPPAIA